MNARNKKYSKERISELEDMSIETSKTEKKRKKRLGQVMNRVSKNCGTTKGVAYA